MPTGIRLDFVALVCYQMIVAAKGSKPSSELTAVVRRTTPSGIQVLPPVGLSFG